MILDRKRSEPVCRSHGFVTHDGLMAMAVLGLLCAWLLPYWGRDGGWARLASLGGALALMGLLIVLVRFLCAFRSRRPPPDDNGP